MNFVIIAMSDALIGTLASSVLATLVGWFAWSSNARSVKVQHAIAERQMEAEEKQTVLDDKAELVKAQIEANKAQVEAFQKVIKTLTDQYKLSTEEATQLRTRLTEGNIRFDQLDDTLRARDREHSDEIAMLRGQISAMVLERAEAEARIVMLTTEVKRLGGNVTKISRLPENGHNNE